MMKIHSTLVPLLSIDVIQLLNDNIKLLIFLENNTYAKHSTPLSHLNTPKTTFE